MKTNWEWIIEVMRSDRVAMSALLLSTGRCLKWYFDEESPHYCQCLRYWSEECAILDELTVWDMKSFNPNI